MGRASQRIGTRVVRIARALPSGDGVPVVPPLVQSVSFDYGSMAEQDQVFGNERPGYVYGRYGTPTTAALEAALAELEGSGAATCFVTGMAAVHALITAFAARGTGHFLVAADCYGQTRALYERMAREAHLPVSFLDVTDHAAVATALAGTTHATLYVESISNPFLRVVDIAGLARLAHGAGATLVVDSTFTTPALCAPLALGADVVLHSLTKYLNGHGDVMGGAICADEALSAELRDRVILDGAYLPPHEAWLTIRGMRTLELRVQRQCDNALRLARHLAAHPKIARVRYPGLDDHPQHELAERQFGGRFGGVVGVTLARDERAAAFAFIDALEHAASATTVGDVFTEVLYPATSSHRRLPVEERQRLGITDGFVRISCGIEDPEDLVAELDAALEVV
jgi:cystathionine gamma-synthase/methionine-gamma-lyase